VTFGIDHELAFNLVRCVLSAPSDSLELANSVAVTFEMQNDDSKLNAVIHGQTDNTTLCPALQ
jgi:hypothetical protein